MSQDKLNRADDDGKSPAPHDALGAGATDPRQRYEARLISADEAVKAVRSGDRVLVGSGCAEPESLVRAMTRFGVLELSDVEVVHLMTLGTAADYVDHPAFRHNAFFIGSATFVARRRRRPGGLHADFFERDSRVDPLGRATGSMSR